MNTDDEKEQQLQAFRKRCSLLTDKELFKQMWLLGLVGSMEADLTDMSEAAGEPVPPNPNPPVLDVADLQEILRQELKKRNDEKGRQP
jgi:hypothetical protein